MYFSIILPLPLPFLSIAKQKWARWLWPPAQTCTVPCVSGDLNPVICADITYRDVCEADPTYTKILPSHTMMHMRLSPPTYKILLSHPMAHVRLIPRKVAQWDLVNSVMEVLPPKRVISWEKQCWTDWGEGQTHRASTAFHGHRILYLLHLTLTPGGTGERR